MPSNKPGNSPLGFNIIPISKSNLPNLPKPYSPESLVEKLLPDQNGKPLVVSSNQKKEILVDKNDSDSSSSSSVEMKDSNLFSVKKDNRMPDPLKMQNFKNSEESAKIINPQIIQKIPSNEPKLQSDLNAANLNKNLSPAVFSEVPESPEIKNVGISDLNPELSYDKSSLIQKKPSNDNNPISSNLGPESIIKSVIKPSAVKIPPTNNLNISQVNVLKVPSNFNNPPAGKPLISTVPNQNNFPGPFFIESQKNPNNAQIKPVVPTNQIGSDTNNMPPRPQVFKSQISLENKFIPKPDEIVVNNPSNLELEKKIHQESYSKSSDEENIKMNELSSNIPKNAPNSINSSNIIENSKNIPIPQNSFGIQPPKIRSVNQSSMIVSEGLLISSDNKKIPAFPISNFPQKSIIKPVSQGPNIPIVQDNANLGNSNQIKPSNIIFPNNSSNAPFVPVPNYVESPGFINNSKVPPIIKTASNEAFSGFNSKNIPQKSNIPPNPNLSSNIPIPPNPNLSSNIPIPPNQKFQSNQNLPPAIPFQPNQNFLPNSNIPPVPIIQEKNSESFEKIQKINENPKPNPSENKINPLNGPNFPVPSSNILNPQGIKPPKVNLDNLKLRENG